MSRHALLLAIVVAAAFVSGCATKAGVPRPFPGASLPPTGATPTVSVPAPPDTAAAPAAPGPSPSSLSPTPLLATALSYQGVPYRNGGSDPSGFDCSGFVQWVFAQQGHALPREVREQYVRGRRIDRDDIQPGDLVFFETVSRGASHVGIALGDGQFIHAPSSRGVVRIERYGTTYWADRYVGARRIE